MKRAWPLLAAPLLLAAAGPTLDPATIAGQYINHQKNGDTSGASYFTDDVLEIVPISRNAAYFRAALYFYNGHQCSLAGVAHVRGDELVYRTRPDGDPPCTFHMSVDGKHIAFADDDGQCRARYCGERGGLDNEAAFALSTRKPIRYMAKLTTSSEYRDALAEDGRK